MSDGKAPEPPGRSGTRLVGSCREKLHENWNGSQANDGLGSLCGYKLSAAVRPHVRVQTRAVSPEVCRRALCSSRLY